jgi:hypothetical protein
MEIEIQLLLTCIRYLQSLKCRYLSLVNYTNNALNILSTGVPFTIIGILFILINNIINNEMF